MRCPGCPGIELAVFELQANVAAQKCSACGGFWLSSLQFANWIDSVQTSKPASTTGTPTSAPTNDPKAAKICPECGHVMTRYKVGHAMSFSLDRCGHCGGTWFDGGEWEVLKNSPLRDQVHLVFSPSWQSRVRRAE